MWDLKPLLAVNSLGLQRDVKNIQIKDIINGLLSIYAG